MRTPTTQRSNTGRSRYRVLAWLVALTLALPLALSPAASAAPPRPTPSAHTAAVPQQTRRVSLHGKTPAGARSVGSSRAKSPKTLKLALAAQAPGPTANDPSGDVLSLVASDGQQYYQPTYELQDGSGNYFTYCNPTVVSPGGPWSVCTWVIVTDPYSADGTTPWTNSMTNAIYDACGTCSPALPLLTITATAQGTSAPATSPLRC
jgi:hypothetical protein